MRPVSGTYNTVEFGGEGGWRGRNNLQGRWVVPKEDPQTDIRGLRATDQGQKEREGERD